VAQIKFFSARLSIPVIDFGSSNPLSNLWEMHSSGFSGAYCLPQAGAPVPQSGARMMRECVSAQMMTLSMVNWGS
jgi:hypothetical protein